MAEKKYKLDSELIKLTIDKSGETIDWLINTIGVVFEPEVGAGATNLDQLQAY